MRFVKGFIIGAFVGTALGASISRQQGAKLVARTKQQMEPIRTAVSDNAADIADAVTDQAAGAVDQAGSAVVESIHDSGQGGGGSSTNAGAARIGTTT
jgi:hypothetical protein